MAGPSTTTAIPVVPAAGARRPRLIGGAIAVVLLFAGAWLATHRTARLPEATHLARCEALAAAGRFADGIRAARAWMRDWPRATAPYDIELKYWTLFTSTPAAQAAEEERARTVPDVFSLTATALARSQAGKHDEAIDLAGRAIRMDPDDRHGYVVRGIAETAAKRLDAADTSLARACALAGGDPWPYWWMGHHCLALSRNEEAARWASTGLEQPHQLFRLVRLRDASLRALGRTRDAHDELEARFAQRPDDMELQRFLAESLAADGAVDRLVKLAPRLAPEMQRKVPALIAGWMEYRRDLFAQPFRWLGTAHVVSPDGPLTHAADVLLANHVDVKPPQLASWVQAAEKGEPDAMLTLLARGRFSSLSGKQAEANAIAEQICGWPHRRGMPAALMGETIRAADPVEALRLFDLALSVEPMNVAIRVSIARSHAATARPELGLQLLSALPKELQTPSVHAELGHFYEAMRDLEQATVHYQAALGAGYDEPNLAWRLVQSFNDSKAPQGEYLRASALAAALENGSQAAHQLTPTPYFLLSPKR